MPFEEVRAPPVGVCDVFVCTTLSGNVELKLETIVWGRGTNTLFRFVLFCIFLSKIRLPNAKCVSIVCECVWQQTRTSNNLTILSSILKCFSIYSHENIICLFIYLQFSFVRARSRSLCLSLFSRYKKLNIAFFHQWVIVHNDNRTHTQTEKWQMYWMTTKKQNKTNKYITNHDTLTHKYSRCLNVSVLRSVYHWKLRNNT